MPDTATPASKGNPDAVEMRQIAVDQAEKNAGMVLELATALHTQVCAVLAVNPDEYGARSKAAAEIGVTVQRYSQALCGTRGSLSAVLSWVTRWNARRPDSMVSAVFDGHAFGVTLTVSE